MPCSRLQIIVRTAAVLALLLGMTRSASADASDDAAFNETIRPFFTRYCTDCHSGESPEGNLALDAWDEGPQFPARRDTWEKLSQYVEAGMMPPPDSDQPTRDERRKLLDWVSARLDEVDAAGPVDPGRVTIRRLNRAEYDNTIRDLLGVDVHAAQDFPSDDVGYGFDNIGDVLTLPPILLEKYLAAAERIADEAIVAETTVSVTTRTFTGRQLRGDGPRGVLASHGEIFAEPDIEIPGNYHIRVRVSGDQAGPDLPRMNLKLGETALGQFDISGSDDGPQTVEVTTRLETGSYRLAAEFTNDYYQPDAEDPKLRGDRNLRIHSFAIEGPFDAGPPLLTQSHQRLIFCRPEGEHPSQAAIDEAARQILSRLATRAFRRPVTDDELARLTALVNTAIADGDSFESGIELALTAVLVSPHFLFRVELDETDGAGTIAPVDDWQLASRLSYFLWSTMPDDALFELAAVGKLHEPAVLEEQVRRMLADPKSRSLVDNFASQWLQLRRLETIEPDREQFKGFDPTLREAMRAESEAFFEHIIRDDRSIIELLSADYTFLNERLAFHYGIEGVEGKELRKVALSDARRGGVLTQASILTITSNPTRTSPVKRGKWIMEQILDVPPPPPPPEVTPLEDVKLAGTLRQRMEQHRQNAACAVCHAQMDALGFAFENFDAVGAWRDKDGEFAVDAAGSLPDGRIFDGPAGLRQILLEERDRFARGLTKNLLTYALGRGLQPADRPAITRIVRTLGENDYRFSVLVLEIVRSQPFLFRRTKGAES